MNGAGAANGGGDVGSRPGTAGNAAATAASGPRGEEDASTVVGTVGYAPPEPQGVAVSGGGGEGAPGAAYNSGGATADGLTTTAAAGGASSSAAAASDRKSRRLFAGTPLSPERVAELRAAQAPFAGNAIRTTKYTLLTFLPISLYEQFTWVLFSLLIYP
jgi:hypothetical protein